MEFIVSLFNIDDIARYAKCGIDGVVVATPFYSARGVYNFDGCELEGIKILCEQHHLKMYVLVNRFFMEEDLEDLRDYLQYLKDIDVDGIYYGDEGVLYEAMRLDMHHKLIYSPDTLTTSYEDVQYYLDEGIAMVTISKDLTLDEVCSIAKKVQGNCEWILHGRLNIMHSKRHLLTNYFNFIGKDIDVHNKKDVYIMEETRDDHMPIVEDDLGTHVFSGFTLVSFKQIQALQDAGITHFRIDGIFHDADYVCDVVRLYKDVLANTISGEEALQLFNEKYPQDCGDDRLYYHKTSLVK